MKILYGLLIFLMLSPSAWGIAGESNFEGLFYKSKSQFYFKDSRANTIVKLVPKDRFVAQDLARLDSSDALMGSGVLNEETNTLFLSAVHFVGLSKMLGVWRAEANKLIFEFVDFNKFNVYQRQGRRPKLRTTPAQYYPIKSYQYSIAPDAKETWSILINDETSINAGKLEVTHSTIEIELIDPNTGAVDRTLVLKRDH